MAAVSFPGRLLAGILLAQAVTYYAVASRAERVPATAPLSVFPRAVGDWAAAADFPLEKEVQDVLKADDTLNRIYVHPRRPAAAYLFVAFFRTQRYGQSPHSPKNCLPGSGWQPAEDRKLPVSMPGRAAPVVVNEYVISRGDEQNVVLYWYQSHSRVIAGEFAAKFWLVADAIRLHRSDTALVRVIVPVRPAAPIGQAESVAVEFAQAAYPEISRSLPQ